MEAHFPNHTQQARPAQVERIPFILAGHSWIAAGFDFFFFFFHFERGQNKVQVLLLEATVCNHLHVQAVLFIVCGCKVWTRLSNVHHSHQVWDIRYGRVNGSTFLSAPYTVRLYDVLSIFFSSNQKCSAVCRRMQTHTQICSVWSWIRGVCVDVCVRVCVLMNFKTAKDKHGAASTETGFKSSLIKVKGQSVF